MAKTATKRNPQDSTRRNVQAANKQFADHDAQLEQLGNEYEELRNRLKVLEQNVAHALDRLTSVESRLGPTFNSNENLLARMRSLEARLEGPR